MAEIKWIKLTTDMFDNRKIKHLRKLPEGNNIVLIWVMLLTMAGRCNAGGLIFLTENIPYTPKMLADELGFEENTVLLALNALERFNMVVSDQGYFAIAGWQEHQNVEGMDKIREDTRKRVAAHREKQRMLAASNVTCNVTVTQGNATEEDKEIDTEEEIEKDKDKKRGKKKSPSPTRHKHGKYSNVLLSDEDMEKLKSEFPDDWERRIERLSEYLESKGAKYKNHLATIRSWARRDAEKRNAQASGNGMYYMPNQPVEDDSGDFIKTYFPGGM